MSVRRVDRLFVGLTASIVVIGLITFVSASLGSVIDSSAEFWRSVTLQFGLGLVGGVIALVAAFSIDPKRIKQWSLLFFIGSLVLTAATFLPFIGLTLNGATRWINLGFTTFQPAELLKIAYVVYIAAWASRPFNITRVSEGLLPFGLITIVPMLLLLLQPDTDTALVLAASGMAIMVAAGLPWRQIAMIGVVGVLALGLVVMVRPYLWDRIESYIYQNADPLGSGFQLNQALIAIGSGGTWGRGFGQSVQKFTYLPEADTDSIFAVYAEEFGFVGALLLIVLYTLWTVRGYSLALTAMTPFTRYLIVGLVSSITLQVFFNIAVMTGLLPVGGLPLVFMSRGGTALLSALLAVGLILGAHARRSA
ncbi:MAG: stage sporulation protein cell division protein FtsW [Candidatus Parcubacteria bacterium]|jgi:cell division protein FtsW